MSAVEKRVEPGAWASRDSAARAPLPRRRPAPGPVPQPRSGVRRELGAIILAAGIAGLCAAGSACVVQADFTMQAASTVVAQLQDQNRQLSVQYAQMQDPQLIEQEAIDQFGMHRPAGYVPIPVDAIPPAPRPQPTTGGAAVLPAPAGPAPGGPVALLRAASARTVGAWRGILGLFGHAGTGARR